MQDSSDIHLPEPLSLRSIMRMGDELVRLCDGVEKYGLVDYQLGVWEEKIETCKPFHARIRSNSLELPLFHLPGANCVSLGFSIRGRSKPL